MNISDTIGFYDGIKFKLDLLINQNNTLKQTVEKVTSAKQIRMRLAEKLQNKVISAQNTDQKFRLDNLVNILETSHI